MGKNNFYIVTGDVKEICDYLKENGFSKLDSVLDLKADYAIIGTIKKMFWTIRKEHLKEVKLLITKMCREPYVELSFEEFK